MLWVMVEKLLPSLECRRRKRPSIASHLEGPPLLETFKVCSGILALACHPLLVFPLCILGVYMTGSEGCSLQKGREKASSNFSRREQSQEASLKKEGGMCDKGKDGQMGEVKLTPSGALTKLQLLKSPAGGNTETQNLSAPL